MAKSRSTKQEDKSLKPQGGSTLQPGQDLFKMSLERALNRKVSEKEADLKAGKISVTSPIGKGILGKKVGETAEVQAPAGVLNFRIDAISAG